MNKKLNLLIFIDELKHFFNILMQPIKLEPHTIWILTIMIIIQTPKKKEFAKFIKGIIFGRGKIAPPPRLLERNIFLRLKQKHFEFNF